MTNAVELTVAVLATWRLTHLLQAEDGPWDLLVRLRLLLRSPDGDGRVGRLFDCFYCLSLWIALPFAAWLGTGWREILLLWPALSGGAILLQRATAERAETREIPFYVEDPPEETP